MRYGPNILQLQVFILFIQFKLSPNQDFKVVLWIKKNPNLLRTLCNVFSEWLLSCYFTAA